MHWSADRTRWKWKVLIVFSLASFNNFGNSLANELSRKQKQFDWISKIEDLVWVATQKGTTKSVYIDQMTKGKWDSIAFSATLKLFHLFIRRSRDSPHINHIYGYAKKRSNKKFVNRMLEKISCSSGIFSCHLTFYFRKILN